MKSLQHAFWRAHLLALITLLVACGGGGNGSSPALGENNIALGNNETGTRMMSFANDIEPIMQGKCLGCHTGGPNALAPFSLEGADVANSFKSAIHNGLFNYTIPSTRDYALWCSTTDTLSLIYSSDISTDWDKQWKSWGGAANPMTVKGPDEMLGMIERLAEAPLGGGEDDGETPEAR